MRIFKFMAMIAAISLFLVSCNKEGQFSPKKKIDKIYYSEIRTHEEYDGSTWATIHTDSTYRLKEDWEWDGAKLKSISYYNSLGDLSTVENYIYDGKRLSSIKWSDDFYCTFHYNHGKIDSINYYYGSYLMESYAITHTGGKVSQITLTEGYGLMTSCAMNAFRFLIPNANMESFTKMMSCMRSKMETKGEATFIIQFEWSGRNIHKMTYIHDSSNSETFEFEYDNKRNPYYGLFDMEEFADKPFLSKNNITHETNADHVTQSAFGYTYTYDGDYPATQSCSYTESFEDSRNLYTTTLFFEYK